jgi:tRNA threonylcarbamoyladenosine biosynthesis protein TsaE
VNPAAPPWIVELPDPAATRRLGIALGSALEPGLVVALEGDLGAGKTALSKAAIAAQGAVSEDDVTSPTFVIAVEYEGRVPVLHVDAYRLAGPPDLVALGWGDLAQGERAVLIEWAERVADALPADRLTVGLEHCTVPWPDGIVDARRAIVLARGPRSAAALAKLRAAWDAGGAPDRR